MHKFERGDLALTLVPLAGIPAMSCVEVLQLIPAGSAFALAGHLATDPRDLYACERDFRKVGYAPNELMPLRHDPEEVSQKSQEVPA